MGKEKAYPTFANGTEGCSHRPLCWGPPRFLEVTPASERPCNLSCTSLRRNLCLWSGPHAKLGDRKQINIAWWLGSGINKQSSRWPISFFISPLALPQWNFSLSFFLEKSLSGGSHAPSAVLCQSAPLRSLITSRRPRGSTFPDWIGRIPLFTILLKLVPTPVAREVAGN